MTPLAEYMNLFPVSVVNAFHLWTHKCAPPALKMFLIRTWQPERSWWFSLSEFFFDENHSVTGCSGVAVVRESRKEWEESRGGWRSGQKKNLMTVLAGWLLQWEWFPFDDAVYMLQCWYARSKGAFINILYSNNVPTNNVRTMWHFKRGCS